jgi:hypothetical protein
MPRLNNNYSRRYNCISDLYPHNNICSGKIHMALAWFRLPRLYEVSITFYSGKYDLRSLKSRGAMMMCVSVFKMNGVAQMIV